MKKDRSRKQRRNAASVETRNAETQRRRDAENANNCSRSQITQYAVRSTQYALLFLLSIALLFTIPSLASAVGGEGAAVPASVSLRLDAPPTLVAGTAATVRLSGAVPDGTSATLLLLGSYGPHMVQASFSGGSASFALPAEATRHAGVTDLIASAGEAQARSQLDILPGAPVSPVVPMVGPRSTVADGRVELMAVVIPTDAWGNPAADGTDVTLRVRQPGNREQQWSMLVAGGLAWERIVSGTRSGRTTVAASSGAASGPEASVREIAGPPASFTLSADPTSLPADGHQTLTLRTGQVQDRYGNTLPDGTLVTFIVEAADGTVPPRRLPALLVGGVAETPLQAPATPGTMRARASIAGVLSPVVELHFTP